MRHFWFCPTVMYPDEKQLKCRCKEQAKGKESTMCRCEYGICKKDCKCRCHIESYGDTIVRLRQELKTVIADVNHAWINALHKNAIVDMEDADGENRKEILAMVAEELAKIHEERNR